MSKVKIPVPVSGGVLLSYKCPAECRHCMYACSPRWKADWITAEDLERGLSQLAGRIQPSPWGQDAIGVNDGLHLSGGEPFMNFELLQSAVEIAHGLGIPSLFVETNGFWCTSDERTTDKLQLLKQAGLKGILISVNPYYAEWVPFERTERCIRVSLKVFGHNVIVYQLEYYRRFKELGIRDRISVESYLVRTGNEPIARGVELFLMGRATRALRNLYPAFPASSFLWGPCRPPFLRPWHNHFDNYGHFMPGFCGGISLGSWYRLDDLVEEGIDLSERPLLRFLIDEDLGGLFHFARDHGYRESPEGYVSRCDLCLDVRKFLAGRGHFEELQPAAFYEHLG